ncbi:MAG: ESPR-type extended signal peptide-containing protein, partial [Hydrogenophilaceae bacterium]
MNKTYRLVWNAATGAWLAVAETTRVRGKGGNRAVLAAGTMAALLAGAPTTSEAALVSACTGVSLPPSVVTGLLDPVLGPVLNLVDLGGLLGLSTTWNSIAAGDPISLNVLTTSGTVLDPTADPTCITTADAFTIDPPKGISIGGGYITGLGDPNAPVASAGEFDAIAFGNSATTATGANNAIAIGSGATIGASGADSVVLGSGANTDVANSVALGAGSTATRGAETGYTAYGLTAPQNSVGEVSVGSAGNERTISNVAAGSAATDAVNVSQLQAVNDGAVKYDDPALKMTVTLGGTSSTDGGITNGTTITNLHQGAVNATSTDAVNGAQLYALQGDITGNNDAIGLKLATYLGGGTVYDTTTHDFTTGPSYTVYGGSYNSVGSAITALQTSGPVQYVDSSGNPTTTPTNEVTLVGADPNAPVQVHNVADPTADTDAANKRYVDNAVNQGITDANVVSYDSSAKDKVTLAGPTSTDGGATGGTTITNLHQGELSATSTDAVNGSQLYATNQQIENIQNGGGIKYFHANSTKGDSTASGTDSVAVGGDAVSSGAGSVAMGDNAQATQAGAIAIGQNASSSGVDSIAIGHGAVATGSVAVGSGAQAGNGGAAFGDNAVALAPQQGTAVGNGATVTSDQGVALGANSVAGRAGMNGTTEKYSNVAVTSSQGAVSVGSAGNERQITNVAGGTAPTDAVNVRQLDAGIAQANQYTDTQIANLGL